MSSILRNFNLKRNCKVALSLIPRRNYTLNIYKFAPFYENLAVCADRRAVIDTHGTYKYKDILSASYLIAKRIKQLFPDAKQNPERISFLCTSDATYVSVFLACWLTGNVAVPLCTSHPASMLEYYVEDSESKLVISNEKYMDTMEQIASKLNSSFLCVDRDILSSDPSAQFPDILKSEFFQWDNTYADRNALIIYTSGTTGRPKGVVLTHGNLFYQISAVIKNWEINSEDTILHALPLHHIHGIMNALLCPLRAGGTIVMQPKFNPTQAWEYFLSESPRTFKVNLFFAVPTMYVKLIQEFEKGGISDKEARDKCLYNMRLFSSGSSSLPIPVFHRWEEITGHTLLERFGMSEIGMATSNPLRGKRIPGAVGNPLPKVEIKIAKPGDTPDLKFTDLVVGNDRSVDIMPGWEGEPGELLIRGPNVFKEYYNREQATKEAFTEDCWFQTGDTACYEGGTLKILGRTSVDIIKSGGFKISALEVESCLLRNPDIKECTVLGIDDNVWGERVGAVLVFAQGKKIDSDDLRAWCKQYIPAYAVPTIIKSVEEIPRNVMGKVNKKELKKNFDSI